MDIVNLHIVYDKYHTGVDRYLQMHKEGMSSFHQAQHIRVHSIYFYTDKKLLFPKISADSDGIITAMIPLPHKTKLLFKDYFWKKRYNEVIVELLKPILSRLISPIFQCHNLFLTDLAELLRDRFSSKMIIHLHCLPWKFSAENDKSRYNRLYDLFEKGSFEEFKKYEKSAVRYNAADLIIALSCSARNYLINIHNIPPHKIVIIPNGLNDSFYKEPKVARNNVLLYVGKVSHDKGIFELMRTLAELKKRNVGVKLKIAGSYTEKVKTEIEQIRGLDIELLGQITFPELQELYTTCMAGVIPSLHEQCSYVALEMAMYGMPLIVSDVDALAEMFESEETALKVPQVFDRDFGASANIDIFMNNIVEIMGNENLRNKLSKNIRKLFIEKYTLECMINNTLDAYKSIS